ncbi:MAG: hypothetical protein F6K58_21045 [Symploca sp. SIO2E9]|nr:hypothetical protein [Symploca sp. SIO2E9]
MGRGGDGEMGRWGEGEMDLSVRTYSVSQIDEVHLIFFPLLPTPYSLLPKIAALTN